MRRAIAIGLWLAGCARPPTTAPAQSPAAVPASDAACCCRHIESYSIAGEPDGPDRWEEYEAYTVMPEAACVGTPMYGSCEPAISDACKPR